MYDTDAHQGKFTASRMYELCAVDGKPDIDIQRTGSKGAWTAVINGVAGQTFETAKACDDYIKEQRADLAVNFLSAGAKSYAEEKAMELLSSPEEGEEFASHHLDRGNRNEQLIVDYLSYHLNGEITKTGDNQEFIDYGYWGATPDGLLPKDGMVIPIEVKSPARKKHFDYLMSFARGESLLNINPTYYYQCQTQIMATYAPYGYWCSFNASYHNQDNQFVIHRIDRDQAVIDRIRLKLSIAKDYRDKLVASLG